MHKMVNGVKVEMSVEEIKEFEEMRTQAALEMANREEERQALLEKKVHSLKADGLSQTSIELLLPESKEYFENAGS